jgi:hypothetical protein
MAADGLSFLSDRLAVESFASHDLLRRLRERCSFYQQHMDELQTARQNAVAVRRDWRNPLDSQAYLADPDLLRDVQRIDGERRAERLSFWRDLNDLRSKLPEQWLSYLASYRRNQLFSTPASTTQESFDSAAETSGASGGRGGGEWGA